MKCQLELAEEIVLSMLNVKTLKAPSEILLRDNAQGAAERKTQTYGIYRQELSEHATSRLTRKMNL
jgi:hypothetical protein